MTVSKRPVQHVCKICGESFSRKYSLNRHTNCLHTRTDVFNCTECDLTFTRKDHLKRHQQEVHLNLRSYAC
ncbi:MAG: C2H2-type zinc finger protein [Candidatus Heimdallarchaeaceae archaeon]|jgi:uncharacterized Zn-finger protein